MPDNYRPHARSSRGTLRLLVVGAVTVLTDGKVTVQAKHPKARWEVVTFQAGVEVFPAAGAFLMFGVGRVNMVNSQELDVSFAATATNRRVRFRVVSQHRQLQTSGGCLTVPATLCPKIGFAFPSLVSTLIGCSTGLTAFVALLRLTSASAQALSTILLGLFGTTRNVALPALRRKAGLSPNLCGEELFLWFAIPAAVARFRLR